MVIQINIFVGLTKSSRVILKVSKRGRTGQGEREKKKGSKGVGRGKQNSCAIANLV